MKKDVDALGGPAFDHALEGGRLAPSRRAQGIALIWPGRAAGQRSQVVQDRMTTLSDPWHDRATVAELSFGVDNVTYSMGADEG